jgi:hypothetical protein
MSDFGNAFWIDRDEATGRQGTFINAANMGIVHPSINTMHEQFLIPLPDGRRGIAIRGNTYIKLIVPGDGTFPRHQVFGAGEDVVIADAEQRLDEGSAFQAGADYCVYLCHRLDAQGRDVADVAVSRRTDAPYGYPVGATRRIGGFHTLCADAGAISGHPLSGFHAGDILPLSIWNPLHRPICSPEGMVFIPGLHFWVDIYLQSGTGTGTRSAFDAVMTAGRSYMDHVDDLAAVGKRLLSDEEFQIAAAGSNEQGCLDARPDTTGGHTDKNGRRMLSACGLEDCCGALWQWLGGGGWRFTDTGDAFHPIAINPSTDWPGGKGQIYHSDGRSALIGGSMYGNPAAVCGSRARSASVPRSVCDDKIACRGCAAGKTI